MAFHERPEVDEDEDGERVSNDSLDRSRWIGPFESRWEKTPPERTFLAPDSSLFGRVLKSPRPEFNRIDIEMILLMGDIQL